MGTRNGTRRKKTKTSVHREREQNSEGPDVVAESLRVEPDSEPEELGPTVERHGRLPKISKRGGAELESPSEESGNGELAFGDSGELREPDEPQQSEAEDRAGRVPEGGSPPEVQAATHGGRVLLSDPSIADIAQITLAWLQISEHQFRLFLKAQGVHNLADGSLALDPALIERLRTTGIDGLAFSESQIVRRSVPAERVAVENPSRQVVPQVEAEAQPPLVRPDSRSAIDSRYPLGRILAGGR